MFYHLRMPQRVLERRPVPDVRVDVAWGTACELLLSLSAYRAPELQTAKDVRPPPFLHVPKRLSSPLRAALDRVGAGLHWGNLIGLALTPPAALDIRSLIRKLDSTRAMDVRLTAIGARAPSLRALVDPNVFAEAAQGDRKAHEALLRLSKSRREREALRTLLALGVKETKGAILDALWGWYREVLEPIEGEVAAVLSRDGRAKSALRERLPFETVIEIATNGLEYRPEPWASRVVLVPQLSWRPWNVLQEYQDASIICYPVADESFGVDGEEPSPALVRLHQALGDDKRLRILKRLANGSASLQELATVASLAKSSAHHHMVILRSAGLVRTTTEEQGRYTLRREWIPNVSDQLHRFLEARSP
jgi:DNA-binding transcriptional ArsR family regulator